MLDARLSVTRHAMSPCFHYAAAADVTFISPLRLRAFAATCQRAAIIIVIDTFIFHVISPRH